MVIKTTKQCCTKLRCPSRKHENHIVNIIYWEVCQLITNGELPIDLGYRRMYEISMVGRKGHYVYWA